MEKVRWLLTTEAIVGWMALHPRISVSVSDPEGEVDLAPDELRVTLARGHRMAEARLQADVLNRGAGAVWAEMDRLLPVIQARD